MIETGRPTITFSDTAVSKLQEILEKQGDPNLAVRIRVVGGGCSGLSYQMGLEPPAAMPDDDLFETNGVKVLLDRQSRPYVEGSVVDWEGAVLGSGGFTFRNPNATGSCGCGESFTTSRQAPGGGESFSV